LADLQVFRLVDPQLEVAWSGKDGEHVSKGTKFGVVTGRATSLLVAERVALNFMQRMSGIATATSAMSEAVKVLPPSLPQSRFGHKWGFPTGLFLVHPPHWR
jgi:nicotinate-nucleotide pyrophosphorylase